jgi:hypothetical protein
VTIKPAQWLTIGSNLAVLIGLALVGVQIYQNTELAKAQLANDFYLMDMEFALSVMGDTPAESWVKAIYSPDEITPTDAAVLEAYFAYGMIQINRLRQMSSLGLVEPEIFRNRLGDLRWHLGNEVGKRWWEMQIGYPPEFVETVNERVLSGSAFETNKSVLDALQGSTNSDL